MTLRTPLTFGMAILATALSTAAMAEPKHGHRNDRTHAADHCPPGLAKKTPRCVPPGQAKHQDSLRRGDRFDSGHYAVINNPLRYGLDRRPGWEYYRDGDRAYRVDRETRQVLAVINLIDAFTN